MFEFKGQDWTVEDIQAAADKTGSSYEDALEKLLKAGMTIKEGFELKQIPLEEYAKSRATLPGGPSAAEKLAIGAFGFVEAGRTFLGFGDAIATTRDISVKEQELGRDLNKKEKLNIFKQYQEGGLTPYLEQASNYLNNYITREEGTITQSLLKAAADGDLSQAKIAADKTVDGMIQSLPSIAAARFGPVGLAVLGVSVAGAKFEEEMYKDADRDTGLLLANAAGSGIIEAGFETVTRGLMKRAGFIKGEYGTKVAKEFLKESLLGFGKKLGVAFVKEGTSEALTEATSMYLDKVMLDEDAAASEAFERISDAFLIGGAIGPTITAAGSVKKLSSKARDRAYNTLMTNQDKSALVVINKEANQLGEAVNKADETSKEVIEERLIELNSLANRIKGNNKVAIDEMTKQELDEYVEIIDAQNKITKSYNKSSSTKDKDVLRNKFNELNDQANDIRNKAESRVGDKYLSNVKNIAKDTNAKIEVFNENNGGVDAFQKRYEEISGKKKNVKDADGVEYKGVILINETVAKSKGAISVSSHEFLHTVIGNSFNKLTTKQKINLNKSFFNILNKDQQDAVRSRLKESYKIEGEAIFETEEMFTAFSDAIDKKEISFNEGLFNKSKNVVEEILRVAGRRGEFSNGRQVYNFLKEYHKTVKKGKKSKRVSEFAKVDAVTPEQVAKESRTYTKTDRDVRIDKLGEQYTKEEYGSAKDKKPGKGTDVYFEMYASGDLEAMVRGRITGELRRTPGFLEEDFVNEVLGELKNHVENFDITRKETNEGFGLAGWIRSQVGNKIGNVLKKGAVTEETFTKDIDESTEAQAVAAEQQDISNLEEQDLSARAQVQRQQVESKESEQKYSQFRQEIGFETGGKNYNKVLDATRKSLLLAYKKTESIKDPKQRVDAIIKMLREEYVTKGIRSDLFKPLRETFGKKDYLQKLVQFKEPLVNVSFVSDLVSLERNVAEADRIFTKFVRKLTSKADVEDAVRNNLLPKEALNKIDKGQAVNLYQKRMPTDQELIDFADQPINVFSEKLGAMVRSGLKGTRKEGFIKRAAIGLVFDATMEVRQMEDVIEALESDVSKGMDIEQLSAQINRDVDVKFSKTKPLTNLQIENKVLPSLQKQYDTTKSKIDNGNGTAEDQILLDFISDFMNIIESDVDPVEAYYILENSYEGLNLNGINFSNEKEFIKYVKNFSVSQIRSTGLKAATNYFGDKLSKATTAKQKEDLINEFIVNIGRSTRSGMIDGITTNKLFKEEIIDNMLEEESKSKYTLVDVVVNGEVVGQRINYNGETITMYENIENIKDNVRSDSELRNKINEEAKQAQDFVFEIINSKDLSTAEKMAIVDLMSVDQRGAIRKMYTMGVTVTGNQSSKDLVLEHEIAAKDMVKYIKARIKNNISDKALKEIISQAKVHVLPKEVDTYISLDKNTSSGGRSRYQATNTKKYLQSIEGGLSSPIETVSKTEEIKKYDNVIKFSRTTNPAKGISVLDFDDTLATSKSLVKFTRPDGTKGTLTPEQYAATYEDLSDLGYKFDFSEFSKVVDGKPAPLLNKAKKLAGKFGTKDMFVLTARPADSAPAIREFLKQNGLDIPLENITGLGNSTAEAKALWVADKVANGYNDFYFADDALKNVQAVQNMLDQFDVKSKVQQAKVKFSKSLNEEFNKIIEENKGIDAAETFSKARAERRGKNIGKYEFFISPGADDFTGLLMRLTGKGKKGEQQKEFLHKALVDPYNRAYREMNEMQYNMINDYSNLIKQNPEIKKLLKKDFEDTDFTTEQAIRIHLWSINGIDIPGLSAEEANLISTKVSRDSDLAQFAYDLAKISKQEAGYTKPGSSWVVGSIKSDMKDALDQSRDIFLAEWQQNADEIFSSENLNKLEATYGPQYVSAMKDILYRMKTGKNRPEGKNAMVNKWLNWINGSVGAIMFVNVRSAVLQTLSIVNYLNFENNNIFKAAAAFANQPQFWEDFVFLFNSPTLKVRRSGIQQDLNASELADLVKEGGVKAVIGKLLQLGFTPTQMADSFAISMGGSSYYRNQIKFYTKQGMSESEAETKAYEDFVKVTEETQQSSRPDRISQQQASVLGRLILAFQNTPMQYNRIIKKAGSDLINNRGDWRANVSRIIYYGTAQSLIFSAMQNALFALAFDDEEDEEVLDRKIERISSGMISTILRGSGIKGAVLDTIVKTVKRYAKEQGKDWNKDYAGVLVEALNVSPPIGSKARKIYSAMKTYDWNEEAIGEMPLYDSRNPLWLAVGSVIEGVTNAPTERTVKLINNARTMLDQNVATWQRVAVGLGWSRWDVNLGKDPAVEAAKEKGREKVKQAKKVEKQAKRDQLENKFEADQRKEVKQGKKNITCSAATTSGKRCTNKPVKGGKCTVHEKVEMKSSSAKETQCRRIKSDGKRCKVKTRSKSGFCYYHD